jgi:hypothetical protein
MNKNATITLILFIATAAAVFGWFALEHHLDDDLNLTDLFLPASPTPTLTTTATPIKIAASQAASPFWTVTPQPGWQVCTGIADGHLHVREKPGHQAPILGVLPESSNITPTDQRDGDWLAISAPLAGWVNSKFLCEKPGNGSVSP